MTATAVRHTAEEAPPLGPLLRPDALGVWSWVLGYTAVLTALSVLRVQLGLATGWDLGFYVQALWLLLHRGLGAVSTYTGRPVLADTAAFALLPLAPLYAVGGTGALLALQSLCLGLGYRILRGLAADRGVPVEAAHLAAVLYLLYPTLVGANLFDFHPQALAVPLLLAAVAAAERRRAGWYALLLVASLLVMDSVAVAAAGLGIALLVARRWRWGLPTLGAAAAAAFVDVHVVIPGLTHGATMLQWTGLYRDLGPTPAAGLLGLAAHPWRLLLWVRRPRAWAYLAFLLGPVLGAAILAPRRLPSPWWIPALVVLEANLLSPNPALTDPFSEQSLLAVPFLGLVALDLLGGVPALGRGRRLVALAPALLLLLAYAVHQGRLERRLLPPDPADLAAAEALVPPGAPVVAQDQPLAVLSARAEAWLPTAALVGGVPAGTYVLLDPALHAGTTPPATLAALRARALSTGRAAVLYDRDGVELLRLGSALPPTPRGT